jgi:arginine N-succinyltransferase
MIIIRPIKQSDLTVFAEFSFDSMLGITSLSRDRAKWEEKISISKKSFQMEVKTPGNEEYYFVLEDLTTGRIGGLSGIMAKNRTGHSCFYRIESLATHARHLAAPKEMRILKVSTSNRKASEVCSLYLQPSFRHSGQGRLLSISRFLFIASHPARFQSKMIAEMRGFIDQRQISPFWEGLGRHFCHLSFVELMAQLDLDRTFIHEILPNFPIYIDLLPKEVQEVIGKTHEATKPAERMLQHEGFRFHDEIDSFDGGPLLSAPTKSIRAVSESSLTQIKITNETLSEESEAILSNNRLQEFKSCYGHIRFINKNSAFINEQVAEALQIKNGEIIRYVSSH